MVSGKIVGSTSQFIDCAYKIVNMSICGETCPNDVIMAGLAERGWTDGISRQQVSKLMADLRWNYVSGCDIQSKRQIYSYFRNSLSVQLSYRWG